MRDLTNEERGWIAAMLEDALAPYGRDFHPADAARLIEQRMTVLLHKRERSGRIDALRAAADSLRKDAHNQREQAAGLTFAQGEGVEYETHGSRTAERLARHLDFRAEREVDA